MCMNLRLSCWVLYTARTPTEINLTFCFKLLVGLMVIFFNQLSVRLYRKILLEPLGSLYMQRMWKETSTLYDLFYLTKLTIMCFYVFGVSETYSPPNGFTSVAVPCGRQRLVLARLALCSWEKCRHLALGALLWTQCTLSFMPVHPTLWKASSRSQCSRNLIQPQSILEGFLCSSAFLRRLSGRDAEPLCCGEREGRWREWGRDHLYFSNFSVR